MRLLRSLALLPNYCHPPCLISAPNHAPVAADSTAGRRACAARPRGKAGSERRKACFHPGGSGFLLPRGRGGRWPGPLPVLFNRLSRHNAAFFGTFLGSKKVPSPLRPPPPPHSAKFSAESGSGMLIKESGTSPTMMLSAIRICVCTSTALAPVGSTRRTTARISSQILWRV